jgi:hypothetical protein
MAETLANAEALDIQYETVVTSVEQDGSTVTFQTESGDVYTANRAVVTIPLGVLKANDVNFDPPLSSAKQTAIERLGMLHRATNSFHFHTNCVYVIYLRVLPKTLCIDLLPLHEGFGTCNKIFMAFDEVSFSSAPWASGSAPMDYFAVEAAKEDQPSWVITPPFLSSSVAPPDHLPPSEEFCHPFSCFIVYEHPRAPNLWRVRLFLPLFSYYMTYSFLPPFPSSFLPSFLDALS